MIKEQTMPKKKAAKKKTKPKVVASVGFTKGKARRPRRKA
jgi:hypothetical protein